MPRLLLKAGSAIADHWCPLDSPSPYVLPEQWDAPHVQHRFAEAIGTLLKLFARQPFLQFRPAAAT
jgi:hypothetical protein